MTELSQTLDRAVTLDDIPDAELDRLSEQGFDWIWFLSVWQTGLVGQTISRTNAAWRREFQETLSDLREEDIAGSGFAITGYTVDRRLGGDVALFRLRKRLHERGLRLLLDFVPNHTAIDHPWVTEHPEYYVHGTPEDLARAPRNYFRIKHNSGDLIFAHGRDPYFPGWPDTVQLDYANPSTQAAMLSELMKIAGKCDGVRCDMGMLVVPDVFARTWGKNCQPFWPRATDQVHKSFAGFGFVAEVYWDLEWALQQNGFDYTYDKRLYDRLRDGDARPVREHFQAGLDYQGKLARFLENHDEPRAATTFPGQIHRAAAVLTFFSPGLRFFHQGQFEGRTHRISPHLVRGPSEPMNAEVKQFYDRLLTVLHRPVLRDGQWQLLECAAAWDGNPSCDAFIAFAWQSSDRERVLVTVNYAPHQSQCYVHLPFGDLDGHNWQLRDLLGDAHYERTGSDLNTRGLYLDVGPWQYHVFELKALLSTSA